MKKFIRTVLLALILLISNSVFSQTINQDYLPGLNLLSSSKQDLIETAITNLRAMIINNHNDILTKLRKERGIKVNKKNLNPLLTEIEAFYRKILRENNEWRWDKTNKLIKPYDINIEEIMGYSLNSFLVPPTNTQFNGVKTVSISFYLDRIMTFSFSQPLIINHDYTRFNGYPYDQNSLNDIFKVVEKNFGSFTHQRNTYYTYACSQNGQPEYSEEFKFKEILFEGNLNLFYGMIQRPTSNGCVPNGHHLASISFYISRRL